MFIPIIVSIAGSDSSGGAGTQADLKTISALGGYAASVITAITAQNTLGVQAVHPLPAEVVGAQLESVMEDLAPHALKIGMVHNADTVKVIVECLHKHRPRFMVYDPVMISTSGRRLMTEDTVCILEDALLPLCTLITPNLSEATLLSGQTIHTIEEMEQAAQFLSARYHTSFLLKGGHLEGDDMCDVLCSPTSPRCTLYTHPKIASSNLHGTGCTLSSAIATYLAYGNNLEEAVRRAKVYLSAAIDKGRELHIGQGNGPLWHF